MEVSDARRLKSLEDENRRLKKLLAETMLTAFGVDPLGNSPAEFSAMIAADIELWAEAVKLAGLQAK
jgi:tripartite-type tricarboxylate transporter receptor subunit TctC